MMSVMSMSWVFWGLVSGGGVSSSHADFELAVAVWSVCISI